VDDSGDGRVAAELQSEFPPVRWTIHESNDGFGASANDAVKACEADIVVLLNDDVQIACDPAAQLESVFRDPIVFAATLQSLHADGTFREGAKRLIWPMGIPRILHNPQDQKSPQDGLHTSDYAVGGHAAYRRDYFLKLNGFDPLFHPFYWEDVDLCIRARKQGYNTVYLPKCKVIHDGRSSIRSQHDAAYLRTITLRNRLLFAWRHLPPHLYAFHQMSLAYHRISARLLRDSEFTDAYFTARERQRALS